MINNLLSALGGLLLAQKVAAHGHITKWVIDGVSKNGFKPSGYSAGGKLEYGPTAERPTNNGDNGFADYKSAVVACGGLEARTDLETWEISGGSKVVAQWDQWPESHKGPVIEYMASCGGETCSGVDAASLSWFKISEANFEGKWPSETITATKNWEFTIPSDLAPGAYLVRHEIIAMHSKGSPQVYPVCFQANLSGSGSAVPADTTTFPAAYSINPVFESWDLYNGGDQSLFTSPGPAVYGGGGGGGAAPAPAPAPSASASASASEVVSSVVAPSASSVIAPSASTSVIPPAQSSEQAVEYPTEPTASVPVESAPIASSATSAQPSAQPTAPTSPAPIPAPAPGGGTGSGSGGYMGGPAPPITENGTRFEVNGGSYHDRASAIQASCMLQMNACKKDANALPNAQVGAGLTACDAQLTTCTASSASGRKRDVINRYSKRSIRVL